MLVDSHAHLLMLDVSPEEAVEEARGAGVGVVVNIGTDAEDSRKGVALAAALPHVCTTVGIHPHNAHAYTASDLEAVAELSESPGVVAIGEVGLDYYRGRETGEAQRALFEDEISLANDLRMPLVIHCREAFEDVMSLLSGARVPVVLHCFEGGRREVEEAKERGYYIGLTGNVTYKNSRTAGVLDLIDAERLLLETDSPYLSPRPVRGRRNRPANVVHTARFVAERLGVPEEEIARTTTANARRLFGLPPEVE
ncbi:MAG: TatD family hydrolase [Rubrobacteraceae bacterium]|nr:TatD family hydrolase [Rubrobacteraceae bacterium]